MKKVFFYVFVALMASFVMTNMTSCYVETGTVEVELGYDLDNSGNLSFDNFDILYSTDVCQETKKAICNHGFMAIDGHKDLLMSTSSITKLEAKVQLKTAIQEAKTEELAKQDGVDKDFVVRYRLGGEGNWDEAFRGR